MPAAGTAVNSNADGGEPAGPIDLFGLLPNDVAAHLLKCAGGPSALQSTRATSTVWKAAIDSLVVSAACSILPRTPYSSSHPCWSALVALPGLHTVDFSSCCEPLQAGQLGSVLQALSLLPKLRCLKLSTWCLTVTPQGRTQNQQQSHSAAAATGGLNEAGQVVTTAPSDLCHVLVVPVELRLITQLQELSISLCAEVSPPAACRMELSPAVMQLNKLTRLELHGFLPHIHHLRGIKHLRHLRISTQSTTAAAAGGYPDPNRAAINAAMAAVHAGCSLSSLHVQLSAGSYSTFMSDSGASELITLLCELGSADSAAAAPQENTISSAGGTARETASGVAAGLPSDCSCKLHQLSLIGAGILYHIPQKFAAACAGLQQLDLSRSHLSAGAADVLGGLGHLTSLCLSDCSLTGLPPSWSQLTQLKVLNMSGNVLGVLPMFISRLGALVQLVISSTHLLSLPAYISSLTGLEHMDVSSNKLQDIPTELCSCAHLRHLDVSKNRLLALPEQFSQLTHITLLNLTGNHLEGVPSGLHRLHHLSHLGLALNYYKAWSHAAPCFISLADSLQELELQHTATVLDDAAGFLQAVGQLTALTSLCAGSNQLSDLPDVWTQLRRLKVLQLSHNAMELLPESLLLLTALTYLDVSYNRLVSLPDWVDSCNKLQQLKRLNLAKNHLTALPSWLSGLSSLTQLQLQGNNLARVPPCLGQLLQLRVLNMGGNYKLKEGGLGQQLAAIPSLRDVVLPYRLVDAAAELKKAGKTVQLD